MKLKKFTTTLLFLSLSCLLIFPFHTNYSTVYAEKGEETAKTTTNQTAIDAKAAIAIDFETGKIFYQQNADEVLGIASMTKIISMYVVLDAIKEGKIKWEEEVTIPNYIYPLSQNMELSNVPLYRENKYTVKDLYEASLISSANGATMALANKVAGSEAKFVGLMKQKLKNLNIHDAKIVNSSGLTNLYLGKNRVSGTKAEDENFMSAKDMAILSRHLLQDYPQILETTKLSKKIFQENGPAPFEMTNWNWMLPGLLNEKKGVDGLKTGTTDLAGACFVGTKETNGKRLITVVMHANQHEKNPSARFIETGKLMDNVEKTWKELILRPNNIPLSQKQLPVKKGAKDSIPLKLKDSKEYHIWVKNNQTPTFKETIDEQFLKNGALVAPIHQNVKVGEVKVEVKDDLGYLEEDSKIENVISIETAAEVKRGNFFQLFVELIQDGFYKITHLF